MATKATGQLTIEDPNGVATWIYSEGRLKLDGDVLDGDTFTVGGKQYTYLDDITGAPDGSIFIGADRVDDTQPNTVAAVNLTGTPGVQYAAAMTENPTVRAYPFVGDFSVFSAKTAGAAGNLIALASAFFNSGDNEWEFGAVTLGDETTGEDGDTITIDGITYGWMESSQMNSVVVGNFILRAAPAESNLARFVDVINGTGGTPGVDHTVGIVTPHPTVSIGAFVADVATVTARVAGSAGNLIGTTSVFLNTPTNGFAAATLLGGSDDPGRRFVPSTDFGLPPPSAARGSGLLGRSRKIPL